jgi:hypothetical protein
VTQRYVPDSGFTTESTEDTEWGTESTQERVEENGTHARTPLG